MTYKVVGFRIDKDKAVTNKKCLTLYEVYKAINYAFISKDCDFISLRRIKK